MEIEGEKERETDKQTNFVVGLFFLNKIYRFSDLNKRIKFFVFFKLLKYNFFYSIFILDLIQTILLTYTFYYYYFISISDLFKLP